MFNFFVILACDTFVCKYYIYFTIKNIRNKIEIIFTFFHCLFYFDILFQRMGTFSIF